LEVVQVVEAVEETMQINLQRPPAAGIIANIIFKLIEGGSISILEVVQMVEVVEQTMQTDKRH
jgi:hypothetical protein